MMQKEQDLSTEALKKAEIRAEEAEKERTEICEKTLPEREWMIQSL